MAKVLIIAGYASSLYNFRGPLIKTLLEKHEVVTTAPFDSDEVSRNIKALGVEYYPNKFERTGLNPLADIYAARDLTKLIKRIKPDCVLAYTIKPVIFGLRAAQKVGIKRTFALVTGLGSGFDQGTRKQSLISKVVKRLYRRTLRRVSGVIFQNPDDQNFFFDERIIGYSKPSVVVNGSGVDLSHYQADLPSNDPLRFLLVARMVKEKGVELFVEAARKIKQNHFNVSFELLGWVDENPNSLSLEQIKSWENEGVITYHGSTDDVRPFVKSASVFVLPTYYREGTPRTILESMAMRRPIITTDTPGCRETVKHGQNGFLIPPRSLEPLIEKIMFFVNNPHEVKKMGDASLKIATERYDVHLVNEQLIEFMNLK